MQGIHTDEDARFHVQHAGASGDTHRLTARNFPLSDGEGPTPGLTIGQHSIHVADQEQAWAMGSIAAMRGDQVIAVLRLPLKVCREAKVLETLL